MAVDIPSLRCWWTHDKLENRTKLVLARRQPYMAEIEVELLWGEMLVCLIFFLSLVIAAMTASSSCFFLLFLFLLSSPSSFLLLLCLEIGVSVYLTGWLQTCYVVQAGSKFQVPLLLFPKCCDYRHVPSHPVLILQTSNMYICAFPDMKYMSFYYASSPAPRVIINSLVLT